MTGEAPQIGEPEQPSVPRYLFLDTQFFDEVQYNFADSTLKALANHGEQGHIRLLLPRIIEREIRSHITERARKVVEAFRDNPITRNSKLSAMVEWRSTIDATTLEAEVVRTFEELLAACKVLRLDTDMIPVSRIQEEYIGKRAPFGGKSSKAQYPDGFAVAALRDWWAEEKEPVAVITNDAQLMLACVNNKSFTAFDKLSEYLAAVQKEADEAAKKYEPPDDGGEGGGGGAEGEDEAISRVRIEKQEPFVLDCLYTLRDMAKDRAADAFEKRGFSLQDEEGDVGAVDVISVELSQDDREILAISEGYALVLVRATVKFRAMLSYDDPNTGIWDGEDQVLMFQERRNETRTYEMEDEFLVEVEFRDSDADSFEIRGVQVEGDVELNVSDGDANYDY